MEIALIAALARNGVIGRDNRLPWRLPSEMRYFAQKTAGASVIMGRKTFESIGKPLRGRVNIVVGSRAPSVYADDMGYILVRSLNEALGVVPSSSSAFIIGGEQLFRAALPLADTLYLTFIDADIEGDAYFPAFDRSLWREAAPREYYPPNVENAFGYAITVWKKS
jgi:dihydrofolate reductase